MNARELTRWAGTRHPDTEVGAVMRDGKVRLIEGRPSNPGGEAAKAVEVERPLPLPPSVREIRQREREAQKRVNTKK